MSETHKTSEVSPSNKTPSSKKNLWIVLVVVAAVVLVGAGIYILSLPKNSAPAYQENSLVPVSKAPANPTPTIPYKEEYQNPFDKKTQYQNPFDKKQETSQNPFDNLK